MAKTRDACEYCREPLRVEERLLTVYRHRRGKHFIFERVTGRVCPGCGERYFSARVVRAMEDQMQARRKHTTVAVPVIDLRAAG